MLISSFKNKITLKAANKQTKKARESEGAKAEQFFKSAYEGYAEVVRNDIVLAEALYKWGFALLHHAKTEDNEKAAELYRDAIDKFKFCLLIEPDHLGAAIDGGVCYMELASIKQIDSNNKLYIRAKKAFKNAERIQKGSASFNIACIFGIEDNEKECLRYLEISKEYGSLPDYEEIITDKDLKTMINKQWFISFMKRLLVEPEPEVENDTKIKYDEEGKVIREVKKDFRKFPEIERDGKVYNVEGNVIRIIEKKSATEVKLKNKVEKPEGIKAPESKLKSKESVNIALKTGIMPKEKQSDVTT